MSLVAGIDYSSKAIDIVLLDETTNHASWHRSWIYDHRGPFYAAESVRRMLPTQSFWDDVYLLGIEDPHSRFPHVAKALGMVAGAIAATLPYTLTVIQTAPAEWKRELCHDAKASKDAVAVCALEQLTEARVDAHDWPQDAFDAYGIAYAVREINARAIRGAAA